MKLWNILNELGLTKKYVFGWNNSGVVDLNRWKLSIQRFIIGIWNLSMDVVRYTCNFWIIIIFVKFRIYLYEKFIEIKNWVKCCWINFWGYVSVKLEGVPINSIIRKLFLEHLNSISKSISLFIIPTFYILLYLYSI